MALTLATPPASPGLVVTLAEAKAHLNVAHADDDALITSQIKAAQVACEVFCQRAFLQSGWEWHRQGWPCMLPLQPINAATVVVSYIPDGAADLTVYSTLSRSLYRLVEHHGGLRFEWRESAIAPDLEHDADAPVKVTFTAGVTAENVPANVKSAVLMIVADLFRTRESMAAHAIAPHSLVAMLLADQQWGPSF